MVTVTEISLTLSMLPRGISLKTLVILILIHLIFDKISERTFSRHLIKVKASLTFQQYKVYITKFVSIERVSRISGVWCIREGQLYALRAQGQQTIKESGR